jgi:hypothetical protein
MKGRRVDESEKNVGVFINWLRGRAKFVMGGVSR